MQLFSFLLLLSFMQPCILLFLIYAVKCFRQNSGYAAFFFSTFSAFVIYAAMYFDYFLIYAIECLRLKSGYSAFFFLFFFFSFYCFCHLCSHVFCYFLFMQSRVLDSNLVMQPFSFLFFLLLSFMQTCILATFVFM